MEVIDLFNNNIIVKFVWFNHHLLEKNFIVLKMI